MDFGLQTRESLRCSFGRMGYDVTGAAMALSEMVRMSQARADKEGLKNVRFKHSEAGAPLPKAEFDTIVCSSVVEYVAEDMALIASLVESLKPTGHLLISVPHSASLIRQGGGFCAHGQRWSSRLFGTSVIRCGVIAKRDFSSKLNGMRDFLRIQCTSFEFSFLGFGWSQALDACRFWARWYWIQGQRAAVAA